MSNLFVKPMTSFGMLLLMVMIVLSISCSSGGGAKLTLEFDEVPLSDNSSKITIKSDVSQWSALAGSMDLACKCAGLAVDRGFRYFYLDEKSWDIEEQSLNTETARRPGFRLTFYNALPAGMSVANPMTAIVYKGEWADGYENGRGTMFYPLGDRYEGDWVEGKAHGSGLLITRLGDRYEGDWRNGSKHGHGVMVMRYGDRYEGEWRNGREHGHGVMIWSYGDRYEGDWSNGTIHGYGTMSSSDGASYEGEWRNGRITGHGVFTTRNGERHESDFFQGVGTDSKGEFIRPKSSFGTTLKRDLYSYGPHRDRAMKEAGDALTASASDAKAEGYLDICKEVKGRFYKQNKVFIDLSPR